MNELRAIIAKAMRIPPEDLGCFTLTDHDSQPATLIMHGPKYSSMWVQSSPDNLPLSLNCVARLIGKPQ
jgi:hypothetical protein